MHVKLTMARNPDRETTFRFKRFLIANRHSAMKVGTDGVLLGAWASVAGVKTAVDVGCGTGLIALMLAQRGVGDVVGVEIDEVAAREAQCNVNSSPWPSNVKIVNCDFVDWMPSCGMAADLMVCNPPFFTEKLHSEDSRRALARHEGSLGVSSLMKHSENILSPDGRLAFISPASRENEIVMEGVAHGLYVNRLARISACPGKPVKRILVEMMRRNAPIEVESIYLRDSNDEFSDRYKELVSDFYLNI